MSEINVEAALHVISQINLARGNGPVMYPDLINIFMAMRSPVATERRHKCDRPECEVCNPIAEEQNLKYGQVMGNLGNLAVCTCGQIGPVHFGYANCPVHKGKPTPPETLQDKFAKYSFLDRSIAQWSYDFSHMAANFYKDRIEQARNEGYNQGVNDSVPSANELIEARKAGRNEAKAAMERCYKELYG